MPKQIRILTEFVVAGESDLDAETDRVMDELLEIEKETRLISDATVSASLTNREVEIAVTVVAETIEEAAEIARPFIEQAIRGAGNGKRQAASGYKKTRSEQLIMA